MTDPLSKRFDVFWSDKERLAKYFKKPEKWFLDFAKKLGLKCLKVLDLGCGNGRNAIPLAQMGCLVTGVDVSQVALDLLREKAQKEGVFIETVKGDITRLPFQSEIFDLALCYNAVFNGDKSIIERSFGEAKRALKSGGFFLVTLRSTKNPVPEGARPTAEKNTYEIEKDGFLLTAHFTDDEEIGFLSNGWRQLSCSEFTEALGKDARPVITIKLELQKLAK